MESSCFLQNASYVWAWGTPMLQKRYILEQKQLLVSGDDMTSNLAVWADLSVAK